MMFPASAESSVWDHLYDQMESLDNWPGIKASQSWWFLPKCELPFLIGFLGWRDENGRGEKKKHCKASTVYTEYTNEVLIKQPESWTCPMVASPTTSRIASSETHNCLLRMEKKNNEFRELNSQRPGELRTPPRHAYARQLCSMTGKNWTTWHWSVIPKRLETTVVRRVFYGWCFQPSWKIWGKTGIFPK